MRVTDWSSRSDEALEIASQVADPYTAAVIIAEIKRREAGEVAGRSDQIEGVGQQARAGGRVAWAAWGAAVAGALSVILAISHRHEAHQVGLLAMPPSVDGGPARTEPMAFNDEGWPRRFSRHCETRRWHRSNASSAQWDEYSWGYRSTRPARRANWRASYGLWALL